MMRDEGLLDRIGRELERAFAPERLGWVIGWAARPVPLRGLAQPFAYEVAGSGEQAIDEVIEASATSRPLTPLARRRAEEVLAASVPLGIGWRVVGAPLSGHALLNEILAAIRRVMAPDDEGWIEPMTAELSELLQPEAGRVIELADLVRRIEALERRQATASGPKKVEELTT